MRSLVLESPWCPQWARNRSGNDVEWKWKRTRSSHTSEHRPDFDFGVEFFFSFIYLFIIIFLFFWDSIFEGRVISCWEGGGVYRIQEKGIDGYGNYLGGECFIRFVARSEDWFPPNGSENRHAQRTRRIIGQASTFSYCRHFFMRGRVFF